MLGAMVRGGGADGLLSRMVALLEAAGIPYMVAGSFASNVHGTPRPTQDLDLVIDPDAPALEALLASLTADRYHVNAATARAAFASRDIFNIVDLETALRVDFIVNRQRPFSTSELGRRVRAEIDGVSVHVASAEDTIIAELEWAKKSAGSETQLRNVIAILDKRGDSLDLAYVERWVKELGVEAEWARARGAASRDHG
jgi:predicted nucleotidyltransferase